MGIHVLLWGESTETMTIQMRYILYLYTSACMSHTQNSILPNKSRCRYGAVMEYNNTFATMFWLTPSALWSANDFQLGFVKNGLMFHRRLGRNDAHIYHTLAHAHTLYRKL